MIEEYSGIDALSYEKKANKSSDRLIEHLPSYEGTKQKRQVHQRS